MADEDTRLMESLSQKMVEVEGGTMMLGLENSDNNPPHKVNLVHRF